jgi:hypothetical protein
VNGADGGIASPCSSASRWMLYKELMNTTARTVYSGEVFTHRVLWKTAREMKEHAEAHADGRFFYSIAAMLIARLTLEAYANFLLHVLHPDAYQRERELFGSCTGAKLAWIHEQLGVTLDPGRRPYQTLRVMDKFRDRVVHGKPDVYAGEDHHAAERESSPMEMRELQRDVAPESLARAFEDVGAIAAQLHPDALRLADHEQKRRLEPFALDSSLQSQETLTTLLP